MTCIVGLVDRNAVWLGGDRAATNGSLGRALIKEPKIFTKGEVGFGVCGLPKVMNALKHGIELPVQSGNDDWAFLVSELVPAIRKGLIKFDAAQENKSPLGIGGGIEFDGAMLIAYRGHLYILEENFQLIESNEKFASIGSGSALALGSFIATKNVRSAKKRILMALEASTNNASCAPPFDTLMIKNRSRRFWK
jgi:ATP-dependent protease HslVU (ClpYQ) peptidase subunit